MLEVIGEEIACELGRAPDDERGEPVVAPGDNVVGGGIVDELVGFGQERSRHWLVLLHYSIHHFLMKEEKGTLGVY